MAKAQVACSVCGKTYSPTYIAQHERAQHRIYRRNAKKATPVPFEERPVPAPDFVAPEVNGKPPKHRFRIVPMLVIEDEADGSIWIAERIKD